MKILLIRHGDPDYEHDTLTEQGWVEAELLARRLQSAAIDDFYLSPLGRAQDTAGVTLKALGRTGETLPWLREFWGGFDEPYTGKRRCPWNLMPQYWTKCPDLFDKNAWLTHPLFASTGEVREVYEEIGVGVEELLLRYGYARGHALPLRAQFPRYHRLVLPLWRGAGHPFALAGRGAARAVGRLFPAHLFGDDARHRGARAGRGVL